MDKGWIIFDESYDSTTRITKCTKTNLSRMFKMKGLEKLTSLLQDIHSSTEFNKESDLVFITSTKKQYNSSFLRMVWNHSVTTIKGTVYKYNGVVSRLVEENKILCYLKPSSTRHTFITIQANAGADLKLLADSCGNSVETIYNHYLDSNRESTLLDI